VTVDRYRQYGVSFPEKQTTSTANPPDPLAVSRILVDTGTLAAKKT
jgi:hypothetical protein